MIIVGVGYYIRTYDDWGAYRDRDFTPVADEWIPGSGGAPAFLSFIESELIPFINANYCADPTTQIIWGASSGGLFALYVMFQRPSLFRGVIAGSPSGFTYGRVLLEIEQAYAESHADLNVALYIAVGSDNDSTEAVQDFVQVIESRGYRGLAFKSEVLRGETHGSAIARTYVTGLRAIFELIE